MSCKSFWSVAKFFQQVFQNCVLRVQRNILRENKALKTNLLRFFEFEWPTWKHPGKRIQQDVKRAVYVSRRTNWGTIIFTWEKYPPHHFRNLNGELSAFRANFSARSSKCTLHLQRMILQSVWLLYLILFFIWAFWAEKFPTCLGIFQQGHKICLSRVQMNISSKYVLLTKNVFI